MIYESFFLALCIFYFRKDLSVLLNNYKFNEKIRIFIEFMEFIHENNPLLLSYYEESDSPLEESNKKLEEKEKELESEERQLQEKKEEKYENKYLSKFKKLTNDHSFVDEDFEYKKNIVSEMIPKIKKDIEKQKSFLNKLNSTKEQILEKIKKKSDLNVQLDKDKDNVNGNDIDDDDDSSDDEEEDLNISLIEVKNAILFEKIELKKRMNLLIPEELEKASHKMMIENKLNKLINNYVMEYTPLGNVVMRYNNDKKTFEYYSNNTIPYRFLEVIGRKYVIAYNCKYIFVDMDDEMKKVSELNKIELTKKKNKKAPVTRLDMFSNKKGVGSIPPPKNNQSIVNPINNIDISIKESNRYTWEGRFYDFKMIKSEKKNISNNISFKEFKKKNQL